MNFWSSIIDINDITESMKKVKLLTVRPYRAYVQKKIPFINATAVDTRKQGTRNYRLIEQVIPKPPLTVPCRRSKFDRTGLAMSFLPCLADAKFHASGGVFSSFSFRPSSTAASAKRF